MDNFLIKITIDTINVGQDRQLSRVLGRVRGNFIM